MDRGSADAAAATRAPRSDAALQHTDVLVIGGGPAGSTIATLLARRGHQVTLLEKDRHPRFHIGESLLPANLPLFDQLGVAAQVRAIGMLKWGAEFVSPWDGRNSDFRFAEAWDKSMPYAYQVLRSQFDEILIRNAAHAGAQVIEGCRVRSVEFDPAPGERGGGASNPDRPGSVRIDAEHQDGCTQRWQARFLVDASGRDTFLANRLGAKRRNPQHNSAALFAHFSGAQRNSGERAGHISIYWFEHGWFWFIPLHDGATSVGAVVWPYYLKSRRVPVREFFLATIALCPPLAQRLADATLTDRGRGHRQLLVRLDAHSRRALSALGDAFAFIDPVFSSGVMLAMHSAFARRRRGRCLPACTGRRSGGAARVRPLGAPRSARILVVHLPRHDTDHARAVHGPAQSAAHEGGAALGAGRRHLRRHADLERGARLQDHLPGVLAAASTAQRARCAPSQSQHSPGLRRQ